MKLFNGMDTISWNKIMEKVSLSMIIMIIISAFVDLLSEYVDMLSNYDYKDMLNCWLIQY